MCTRWSSEGVVEFTSDSNQILKLYGFSDQSAFHSADIWAYQFDGIHSTGSIPYTKYFVVSLLNESGGFPNQKVIAPLQSQENGAILPVTESNDFKQLHSPIRFIQNNGSNYGATQVNGNFKVKVKDSLGQPGDFISGALYLRFNYSYVKKEFQNEFEFNRIYTPTY